MNELQEVIKALRAGATLQKYVSIDGTRKGILVIIKDLQ